MTEDLKLRSLDPVKIRGQEVPRYLAERWGFIPVTIVRGILANGGIPRISWIHVGYDLADVFPRKGYEWPRTGAWQGPRQMRDLDGSKCLGFWPQFLFNNE